MKSVLNNIFKTYPHYLGVSNMMCNFSCINYLIVQHDLKQLFFSLLLCCGLFSFAQEENTTLYVAPNTTIVGLDCLNQNTKIKNLEKEQDKLYIVEGTLFYSSQDLATVTIKGSDEFQKLSENKKYKKNNFSKKNLAKGNEQVLKAQNKTQVTQSPFPFSLPTNQKQTLVYATSTTTVTPSIFSKSNKKKFASYNCFSIAISKMHFQKQNTCYKQNSKPFKVIIKHCNRPPPLL